MNELTKTSNYVSKVNVAKESERVNIRFSKYDLPTNIEKDIDNQYMLLLMEISKKYRWASAPENYVCSKYDFKKSYLKKESLILSQLENKRIDKIENTNYRIIVNIMDSDYTCIINEDLSAGVDNLYSWEQQIKLKYNLNDSSIKDNYLGKVTIIFEDELNSMYSEEYLSKFAYYHHEKIKVFHKTWCSGEQEKEAIDLLLDSSELYRYIDNKTISEVYNWRRYYITITISFNEYEIMKITNHMKGFGSLLMFERYLKEKCLKWAEDKYEGFDGVCFNYDKIEFAFEQ